MQKRIAYIDGLRAIAVLSVVIEHTASFRRDPHLFPGYILRTGMHGVDLFFVISGFCLSYPVLSKLHSTGSGALDLARFAAHRIVRILPPYYIAIVLLAVAAFASGTFISGLDVVKQMLFFDRAEQGLLLNSSFWTLSIEFRWYALFPLMLLLWVRAPRAFGLLALLFACSTATLFSSVDILILPAFMLGIVAADAHLRGFRFVRLALPAFVVLAVAGTLLTPASWTNYAHPIWQLCAFALVLAAGSIGVLQRALSTRILAAIGTASYSIYLVHGPVISFFQEHGMAAPLAALCGVAAGCVFWAIAERPFTQGPLRERLHRDIAAFLPRWFAFLKIPVTLQLGTPAPSAQPHFFAAATSLTETPEALFFPIEERM